MIWPLALGLEPAKKGRGGGRRGRDSGRSQDNSTRGRHDGRDRQQLQQTTALLLTAGSAATAICPAAATAPAAATYFASAAAATTTASAISGLRGIAITVLREMQRIRACRCYCTAPVSVLPTQHANYTLFSGDYTPPFGGGLPLHRCSKPPRRATNIAYPHSRKRERLS